MPRPIFDLELDQVREIVRDLDDSLEPTGFVRLIGGTNDVYRISLLRTLDEMSLQIP
jgi:hypothetical protein